MLQETAWRQIGAKSFLEPILIDHRLSSITNKLQSNILRDLHIFIDKKLQVDVFYWRQNSADVYELTIVMCENNDVYAVHTVLVLYTGK